MIKCYEYSKEGFDKIYKSDEWQVACITYSEQYDIKNFDHMKRHLTTDEVFILVSGKAILYSLDGNNNQISVPVQKGKLYCTEKNTWHFLSVDKDAVIFVIENADLKLKDTERMML